MWSSVIVFINKFSYRIPAVGYGNVFDILQPFLMYHENSQYDGVFTIVLS
jgi:hypothetical protein